jgi:hypothetical protein
MQTDVGVVACSSCGHPVEVPAPVDVAHESVVAACDMLVLRALELVGSRIVRFERSRFARLGGRPWHEAHLLWQPDAVMVDKALANAWGSVGVLIAEHGCCGATCEQLTVILDQYVRDLCATGTGHDVTELRYRLSAYLGMPG